MVVVLLVCLLSQIQAYSRSPDTLELTYEPHWTPESDEVLEQLSKDMFGYSVEDFQKHKTSVFSDENKEGRVCWLKWNRHMVLQNQIKLPTIGMFQVLISFMKFQDKGTRKALKLHLTLIWGRLTSKEQKQWKEKFPYAAHIEKLYNISKDPQPA
ncbi:hypothetical protein GCK32_013165 [Trichostrongylus colubriformis]|uniref:Uncharacterized protein n=1 Tax=Trichostrongylus colubriformis TaxID=6319 RepID=A0AAN8IE47_TRICO